MNDMRQKLLPVFLEEAGRKILLLDSFLAAAGGEGRSLDDLEVAFRAAHTLKGTAALVRAEAVRTLSARMEGLLEGHFEKAQFPSRVEYEAMQLALDCLKQLISAIERYEAEPVGLLGEAEIALNLAMSMPGQNSLASFLDRTESDPFADDPAVVSDDLNLGLSTPPQDPFDEDDAIQLEQADSSDSDDPFAEDDAIQLEQPDSSDSDDPFAEDDAIQLEQPDSSDSDDPFAEDDAIQLEQPDSSDSDDPFAEDDAIQLEQPDSSDSDDPFAEDDAIQLEQPCSGDSDDPFAEDPENFGIESQAEAPAPIIDKPDSDPFVDDPDLYGETSSTIDPAAISFADIAEATGSPEKIILGDIEPVSTPVVVPEPVKVARQGDSFVDRMRKRIEKESPLETAIRLSETLLRQNEGEVVARNFKCCHFQVARKEYYLPIANMIEIADLSQIIRLPLAPPVVKGLINLRGQVLPVIDLGAQDGRAVSFVAVQKLVIAEASGERLAFLTDGIPDLTEELRGEKVDVIYFVDQFRAGGS